MRMRRRRGSGELVVVVLLHDGNQEEMNVGGQVRGMRDGRLRCRGVGHRNRIGSKNRKGKGEVMGWERGMGLRWRCVWVG